MTIINSIFKNKKTNVFNKKTSEIMRLSICMDNFEKKKEKEKIN